MNGCLFIYFDQQWNQFMVKFLFFSEIFSNEDPDKEKRIINNQRPTGLFSFHMSREICIFSSFSEHSSVAPDYCSERKKNKNSLTWQSWTRLNVQIVILSISIVSSWTHASKSFDRSILMMLFQIFVVWRQTLDSCKYLDQWHFWSEFPLGTFFSLSLSHSLI